MRRTKGGVLVIVVLGATGNIGRVLVDRLLAAGERVRAVTRDPTQARFPAGVDVVRADRVPDILVGSEALFALQAGSMDLRPLLAGAGAEGVQRVVLVSSLLAQTHPNSLIGQASRQMERAVRESGLNWTVLRPWEFASNTVAWAPAIRETGVVRVPTAGKASPVVHPGDIAAVALHALTEAGHHGQTYPLSGPVELTMRQKVQAIGAALHRELVVEIGRGSEANEPSAPQPPDAVTAALMIPGVSQLDSPGTLPTIEEVTGTPALSFEHWAHEHANSFR